MKIQTNKKWGGGWGSGRGGGGRCELRSEVFVKIKKNIYIFFLGGGGRVGGGGVRVDVNEELEFL